MRKNKNLLVIKPAIIVLLFLVSISCTPAVEKFNQPIIGNYNTIETITCYGASPPCSSTTNVVVEVTAGSNDSSVMVLGRDIKLSKSGNEYTGYDYHYGIIFRNDSIFSNAMNGGLGGGYYQINIGKKQ